MRLNARVCFPALTQRCHRQRVDPARSNLVSWHLLINSNGISVPGKWHTALFTDRFALSLKMSPRFISSPASFSPSFPPPAPLCSPPVLRSHAHLGVVPVLHCAAEVYNLRRLLVWLHMASSSVLYFFCRNSKLGCLPCLSLCHRCSLLCEIKAKHQHLQSPSRQTAFLTEDAG